MTNSLRALLTGAIDYAGMFPPAELALNESVANYRNYMDGPESWLLGRFVCPSSKLTDLSVLDFPLGNRPISVVAKPIVERDTDEFEKEFDALRADIGAFPSPNSIDAFEFRLPAELERYPRQLLWFAMPETTQVARIIQPFPDRYLEFTPSDRTLDVPEWRKMLAKRIVFLGFYKKSTGNTFPPTGLKLRMGGTTASAVPSSWQVAAVICACRDAGESWNSTGIFWKATAGLHRALAHFDDQLGVHVHGFLNLFAAAALADSQGMEERTVQEILDDQDASHFQFTDEALSWGDLSIDCDEIKRARQRGLRSFGSCSFEEPVADLRALGLL